jgi:hypothetical protein
VPQAGLKDAALMRSTAQCPIMPLGGESLMGEHALDAF